MKSIFVSSTFKDMNQERDMFHSIVTPELNEYASTFGDSVELCDLRWGVNTTDMDSDEGSRKVLSVCLDEIDRCRPYMIVLLGDRYGWVPHKDLTSSVIDHYQTFSMDDLEKSVTALEIEYGALCNEEQLKRTLFYFRNIENEAPAFYYEQDEVQKAKLEQLKNRILRVCKDQVRTYNVHWNDETSSFEGIESLCDMIVQDVKKLMAKEWEYVSRLSSFDKDRHAQWNYALSKANAFSIRQEMVDNCIYQLNNLPVFAMCAKDGEGKTTLLSKIALTLLEYEYEVLPIYCGYTSLCHSGADIVKYVVTYFENHLKITCEKDDFDDEKWVEYLHDLVYRYEDSECKPCVILIDGIDQLSQDDIAIYQRFIPINLNKKCKMIVTLDENYAIHDRIEVYGIDALEKAEKKELVQGLFLSKNKEISKEVLETIVLKEGSDSPLYLSLLVQRLLMMNQSDFENINKAGGTSKDIDDYQKALILNCADKEEELCVEIFGEACKQVGDHFVSKAIELLAISSCGLREKDIEGIFKQMNIAFDALSFARLKKYMRTFFIIREDGRIDFSHTSIRDGFKKRVQNEKQYHSFIVDYLLSLPSYDTIRKTEMVYHLILSDDKKGFVNYIENSTQEDTLHLATIALVHYCEKDNGEWLLRLIEDGYTTHRFIEYINTFFTTIAITSIDHLYLYRNVFEAIVDTYDKDEKKADVLCASYKKLADVCVTLEGMDHFEEAIFAYGRALELCMDVNSAIKINISLGNVYVSIASYKNDDKEYLDYAFAYYQHAKQLLEENVEDTLLLSTIYHKLGNVYSLLADEYDANCMELKASFVSYSEELHILETLYKINPTLEIKERLVDVHNSIGMILQLMNQREDKVYSYFKKALSLQEEIFTKYKSLHAMNALMKCYMNMGDMCKKVKDDESVEHALNFYTQSVKIGMFLNEQLGTLTSLQMVLLATLKIADYDKVEVAIRKQQYTNAIDMLEDLCAWVGSKREYHLLKHCKKQLEILS